MRSRFRTSLNQVLQSTLMVENMPITLCPTIINPMRERCLIGFQRNRRKRISKRAGFSLLELVIVGAILLITTAMAVPIFQNVRRTYQLRDRKSTRLNSSHVAISYAVFCLKK